MDSLEFRLLGRVEVHRNGRPVDVGGPKQRALLASLLLRPAGWSRWTSSSTTCETLTGHACRQHYERPDMVKGETHDAYICSLDLFTDKVGDHVLPAPVRDT